MPAQTSYDESMQLAMPGMRSDNSLEQTDGCCAAQGAIKPGYVVALVSVENDGSVVKQVSDAADKLMGIARFSHFECDTGQYEDGCSTNVMIFGRIWAVTPDAAAPAPGAIVQVVAAGDDAGKVTATTGVQWDGCTFTGRFTLFNGIPLAEVQLRNQTVAVAP